MTGKYLPAFGFSDLLSAVWQGGDSHAKLREQLGRLHGVRHVFLFRSARTALAGLLRVMGGPGVVVVPAYNCIAVPEAVTSAGWESAFADVAEGDVNMTAATLTEHLPANARAVILTHQFGLPSDVEAILEVCRRRKLFVIEDAAPALGARYRQTPAGALGDAAIISFHLTKVVNAGAGGALLTNDSAVAEKLAALQGDAGGCLGDFGKALVWWAATRPACYGIHRNVRKYIKREPLYEVAAPGELSPRGLFRPCSGFVAALAGRQVERLAENVASRQNLARIYAEGLAGCRGILLPPVPEGAEPSWIQYPVFVERKEACYNFLLAHGVDLNWTFRYSCGASYQVNHTPNAERAARTVLGLPTYPGLPDREAKRICELLRQFAAN